MKAIGNTVHALARSVRHQAQSLRNALPETHLIEEALQGVASLAAQATARLRRHQPVEVVGQADMSTLNADPEFDAVRSSLLNALPELRYNEAELGKLIRNGGGGATVKEAIERCIGHLHYLVEQFPAPEAGEVTRLDRIAAIRQARSIREHVNYLDELMGEPRKGMSSSRKAAIRASIVQLRAAVEHAETANTTSGLRGNFNRQKVSHW